MQTVLERARQNGYLQTMSGRRRYLLNINSTNYQKRSHDERVTINGTVQGSAADLVKGAMVQLLSDLREEGLSEHCRMMVQVGFRRLLPDSAQHVPSASAGAVEYRWRSKQTKAFLLCCPEPCCQCRQVHTRAGWLCAVL